MLKRSLCFLTILLLVSCGSSKKRTYGKTRTVSVEGSPGVTSKPKKSKRKERKNAKAKAIISTALTFSGTRYKYGGATKKGIDCSGLIFVSLKENDILFPRVSYQMAKEGKRIKLNKVQKGDLLFFKTRKRGKRINHVGLVVDVKRSNIKFIHSTTSRGVIVSSLREGYWNHAFVKAMRIL